MIRSLERVSFYFCIFPILFRYLSKYLNLNSVFKALNDETRRKILELLRDEDMSAGAIAEHFSISKPSISHHLDLLRQAGLVSAEKKGQFVIYSLNSSILEDLMGWIIHLNNRS